MNKRTKKWAVIVLAVAFAVYVGLILLRTPFYEAQKNAGKPKRNGLMRVEIPVKGQKSVVVAVDREGRMTWNGEVVSCEEMQARFRKLEGKPDTKAALAEDKKQCAEELK